MRRAQIAGMIFNMAVLGMGMGMGVSSALASDPENTLILKLDSGEVVIEMRPDLAPKHVERIKQLARRDFYDGLEFFRVEWWVAQTGDPENTGYGESAFPDLQAEFSDEPFMSGAVGMAREGGNPDSANSQFFIVTSDADSLTGAYTLWGRVTSGMEHIDALPRGTPPRNPAKIKDLCVKADKGCG